MYHDGLDFITYDKVYREHRSTEQSKLDWSVTRKSVYNWIVLNKMQKQNSKHQNQKSQNGSINTTSQHKGAQFVNQQKGGFYQMGNQFQPNSFQMKCELGSVN